jgi:hypothetical protein
MNFIEGVVDCGEARHRCEAGLGTRNCERS